MTDTRDTLERTASRLESALSYPFTTNRRVALASVVAVVTYVVLVLSTFPAMSAQMLAAGPQWIDDAVVLLTANTYATVGATGLSLVVVYAFLTGVAVTNAVTLVRVGGADGATSLGGLLPGLVASGCAGCGAGVLGLLGFAGALAALPFHGNLVRAGGVLLLLYFLGRAGDPRACGVDA
ncbi:MAG: hypothetical protein ABEJ22_09885 [Haloferacaceae archaeon]